MSSHTRCDKCNIEVREHWFVEFGFWSAGGERDDDKSEARDLCGLCCKLVMERAGI